MSKLVENGKIVLDGTVPKYEKIRQICSKLERYETEFIVDFDIIIEALNNGVWFRYPSMFGGYEYSFYPKDEVFISKDKIVVIYFDDIDWRYQTYERKISDYRKTWSLRKEDFYD